MHTCHLCQKLAPHHDDDCRVPTDLERFERVCGRLMAEQRNPALLAGLIRHLERYGLLCQSHRS